MNKKFMLAIFDLSKKRNKRQLTVFIIVLLFLFFSSTVAFAKVLNLGTPSDSVYVQGNLGVGTSNPIFKFDVVGGVSSSQSLFAGYNNTSQGLPVSLFSVEAVSYTHLTLPTIYSV